MSRVGYMKIILAAIVLHAAVFLVAAQVPNADWVRLEGAEKNFSVAVPAGFTVVVPEKDKEKDEVLTSSLLGGPESIKWMIVEKMPTVTAYKDGATFLIQGYRTQKLKDALVIFIQSRSQIPSTVPVAVKEFQGIMSQTDDNAHYKLDLVIGSKDCIYRVLGAARNKDNEALKYFFSSLRLDDSAPFALGSSLRVNVKDRAQPIMELKETPFEFEKGEKEDSSKTDDFSKAEGKKEDGFRLVILDQPPAPYSSHAAYKWKIYDKVLLRVTLGAGGQVEKIKVIRGLPLGLTESAVRSARQIRFLPREVDNERVSVEKVIQYDFSPWIGR